MLTQMLSAPVPRKTTYQPKPKMQTPEQLDSLLNALYSTNSTGSLEVFYQDFIDVDTTNAVAKTNIPDSVWAKRLGGIMSAIGLPYNPIVKKYLVAYTTTHKNTVSSVLGRSMYYFPIIEERLEQNGLPIELRMLAVIESALIPNARSRAGASGLWQFMYATGRRYGLEITTFVDQRLDPVASTNAACRYLKDLYNIYGDWSLAIAAYNCGPGNVNKAIKYAGSKAKSFWDIYPYLPRETRGYVPSFIAATYAYTYHSLHGIPIAASAIPLATDTIVINKPLHFEQISTTISLPVQTLRRLNPQYKLDIVPALGKSYSLVIPQNTVSKFLDKAVEIYAKDTIYLSQYIKPSNFDTTKLTTPAVQPAKPAVTTITHRIRSGENLNIIARKYNVTVKEIISWNHMRNPNSIRPGQTLVIHKK